MAAGSLTLGGNMSLAVGPLGRNGEAAGALSTKGKVAAMFVYCCYSRLFLSGLTSLQVQLLENSWPFWWCLS
jgi:lipid-binding SYLF domain-containing protein